MERHHFNHALDILHIAGDFIVNHLTAVERTVFVEKLEQAILATDLKLHMTLVRPKLAGIVAERTLDFSKSTHKDLVNTLLESVGWDRSVG